MDAVVVSVMHGTAAGAGVSLAAAADLVGARQRPRSRSRTPRSASLLTAAARADGLEIGLHRALQLALLNPVVSAVRSVPWGSSRRCTRTRRCLRLSRRWSPLLLSGSRTAQVAAKRLCVRTRDAGKPRRRCAGRRCRSELARPAPTAAEGVAAFMEKPGAALPQQPLKPSLLDGRAVLVKIADAGRSVAARPSALNREVFGQPGTTSPRMVALVDILRYVRREAGDSSAVTASTAGDLDR